MAGMNALIGGLQVDAEAAMTLNRILSEFGPPVDSTGDFSSIGLNDEIPLVGLARLALEHAGFQGRGSSDRTAWEADGLFRGVDIALADTLYGPRMLVSQRCSGDPVQLATDAARAIAKACRLIERRILAPHAREQARLGNLTLPNVNARLHAAYRAFRWHGQALIDGHGDDQIRQAALALAMAAAETEFPGPWFVPSVVGNYVTAMTTAWFSWLEHVLVLLLPFSDWEPTSISIEQVIMQTWSGKWKQVIGIGTPESKATFDMLTQTAEKYRHRDAHGGFGKGDAGILVHTPAGVVPARMSAGLDHIVSGAVPSSIDGLVEAVTFLENAEHFLRTGPFRHGMAWIDGGLDVAFDHANRAELRAALAAGNAAFDEYLDRIAGAQDRANNYEF